MLLPQISLSSTPSPLHTLHVETPSCHRPGATARPYSVVQHETPRFSLGNLHLPMISTTLPLEVSILDWCYGILILQVKSSGVYHVFNPITGGIMPVDHLRVYLHDSISLVVDLLPDSSEQIYDLKLVTVDLYPKRSGSLRVLLRFIVLVPTKDVTKVKSRVRFLCESITLLRDDHIRPVYAHGCLHWLGDHATKVIVFNVERERARIIDGPVKNNDRHGLRSAGYKWFGLAQGSLSYAYVLREEIVVVAHDFSTEEWRVQYKIGDIRIPINMNYMSGLPLFFDGRRLFIQERRREGGDEVYAFDMWSGKWKKRGVVEEWSDSFQRCFPFFPTLAKVSDDYLHNNPTHVRDYHLIKESLIQLQHLLRL